MLIIKNSGKLYIESDVTAEMIKEKILEIQNAGKIFVTHEVLGAVQAVTESSGKIKCKCHV